MTALRCERCGDIFHGHRAVRFCSRNCAKRDADNVRRVRCAECGELLTAKVRKDSLCVACRIIARDRKLETLWSSGMTLAEIASLMGWSRTTAGKAVHKARSRGARLPYRKLPRRPRFTEQVA